MNRIPFNPNLTKSYAAEGGGSDNSDATDNTPLEVISIDNIEHPLDKEGNALASDGSIFKTKSELDTLSAEPTTILIDDVSYSLDENGNAINNNGEVVKSKEDIAKLSTEPPDIDYFGEVKSLFNYTPKDEGGKDIEYEKTPKGITSFINDTLKDLIPSVIEKDRKEFFEANPDLYQAYRHKLAYGNIDGYKNQIDYRTIKVADNNAEQQKNIIIHEKVLKGEDQTTATRFANLSEKEGTLLADSKAAKQYLDKYSKTREDNVNATITQKRNEELAKEKKYWDDVKQKVLVNGKVSVDGKEYIIPAVISFKDNGRINTATREDFISYLTKPIQINLEDGRKITTTKHEYDVMQEEQRRNTIDHDIFEAFNLFTRNNRTSVVDAQFAAKEVAQARKLYTKHTATTKSTGGTNNSGIKLPI